MKLGTKPYNHLEEAEGTERTAILKLKCICHYRGTGNWVAGAEGRMRSEGYPQ